MKTVLNNTIATAMPLQNVKYKISNIECKIYKSKFLLLILPITISLFSCKSQLDICKPPVIADTIKPIPQFAKSTITGVVVDKDGIPINDAAISFDGIAVGNSNSTGSFSFEIEKNINYNYQLVVQKEGLNNSVRTYHTQMGNTAYNIQMGKPCICKPIDETCNCITPIKIIWKNRIIENEQEILDEVVNCLKNNPTCQIGIAYQIADANKEAAPKRLDMIRKYFVQKGISESRITTQIIKNKDDDLNTISIFKQN
jgi:hypothetical protein